MPRPAGKTIIRFLFLERGTAQPPPKTQESQELRLLQTILFQSQAAKAKPGKPYLFLLIHTGRPLIFIVGPGSTLLYTDRPYLSIVARSWPPIYPL